VRKLALWEAKHPKTVLLAALLLLIPALIGFVCTRVNYDVLSYLPDDLPAVQGEQILDDVFHSAGISIVVVEDARAKDAAALKKEIEQIQGVSSVIWIDTIADISVPADILPDRIREIFYSSDGTDTMMLVQYEPVEDPDETLKTISEIKTHLREKTFISGLTVIVEDTKEIANTQAPIYISIAVVLALAVMAIMMESWFQPFVILAALGIAVAYNMGTNFFLGSISFITQAVAAVLQLGVTMDYSIFLIDRYHEEKSLHSTREDAMAAAIVKSFTALTGSSLTTVFGFLALCFMRLKLGFDIGFVMAKGVILGVVTVILVLPAILLLFEDRLERHRHRAFVPEFSGINRFVFRHKRVFAVLFLFLLVPAYLTQSRLELYYSMDKALPADLPSIEGLNRMKEDFNMATTQFVVFDDNLPAEEIMDMERQIRDLDGVSLVLAYHQILGPAIPDNILPDEVLALCKQQGLQLMMVNSEYSSATPELTTQLQQMEQIVRSCDPSAIVTGEGAIIQGLMDTTKRDFAVTAVLSIVAIFILIAICFRSVSLPVILVLSIELAIWINLAISRLMGSVGSFVDPTVVNCVQLGATVDYAILLTTRFQEELRTKPKKEAILEAADSAMRSVFQSAAVFFVATIAVYLTCDIHIVQGMCALLARGAIISEIVIMVFLAPLLYLFEGLIARTTIRWRFCEEGEHVVS
jgi:predicted RND superfamily exporter protein